MARDPKQPKQNEPGRPEPVATHIAGRSPRDRFRRGGIDWTKKWQVFEVAALKPEQVNQIIAEGQSTNGLLEVKLCDADDADELLRYEAEGSAIAVSQSKAELIQALAKAEKRAETAEKALAEFKLRVAGGDLAPRRVGELPEGTVPTAGLTGLTPGPGRDG